MSGLTSFGNVQPNPGPTTSITCLVTPSDLKSRTGLGFTHLNVRSLVPKMDMIRTFQIKKKADIMILLET